MKASRIIFIFIALAAVAAAVFMMIKPDGTGNEPGSQNVFPGSLFPSSNEPQGEEISVLLNDGTTAQIPNVAAGKTPSPLSNATYYELTEGNAAVSERFTVTYGTDSSFAVSLVDEPVRQARLDAEAYLRQTLQLSDEQLCALDVTVAVPYSVNEYYAGTNLGLSFCPGAVLLP